MTQCTGGSASQESAEPARQCVPRQEPGNKIVEDVHSNGSGEPSYKMCARRARATEQDSSEGSPVTTATQPESGNVPTEVDYSSVTEVPGVAIHQQQLSALYTRYHFAREYSEGNDVLEVACGAGMGLGYLAQVANRVVGGDIDEKCLRFAEETYAGNDKVQIRKLDAQNLPFDDDSFDLVLMYEAIYYLPEPEKFFSEARRVLRPSGVLIVVSVNPEWAGFNPSPFSIRYLSPMELADAMRAAGFEPEIKVAFFDDPDTLMRKIVGLARKIAGALHLIPKTMRGKEFLKRLFYGKLSPISRELSGGCVHVELLHDPPPGDEPIRNFKVIYATGKLPR